MSDDHGLTRRKFLGNAAAGALVAGLSSGAAQAQDGDAPARAGKREPSDVINVGFIGVGVRGKQLMEYAGFPSPKSSRDRGRGRSRRSGARRSETDNLPRPLNIRCLGVSDLYRGNLDWGRAAGGRSCKTYPNYEDMLANPEIDAVFIATSDHNHAPIGIDAARAGKAIYSEKCFANSIPAAKDYRDAVRKAGVVFQLGHQTRSGSLMAGAHKALGSVGPDGLLGKVTLIETYTHRNTPNGAWIYRIPRDASPETVDWKRFLGNAPKRDFDADRFFRWRKYWDYGTGLFGDLLTHEMDAVQHVTGLGIPDTATANGGIYYWTDDGRETPDTLQVSLNYEDAGVVVLYTATLANGWRREQKYFGHDATMDLSGGRARVYIDADSDRYAERIEKGEWEIPVGNEADRAALAKIRAETSDTRRWTIDKGIYVDIIDGREINVTALHILNFVESIRAGNLKTNCHLDIAFEEAVTAHMAKLAFLRGRRIRWDRKREKVVSDG